MTKREYEQAKLAGASARQAGRPRTSCPMYALGQQGQQLRDVWQQAWDDEDAARKRK